MGPKEWAKANGFPDIKLGKGRMPADARAAAEAYVASGGHIDGMAVSKPTSATAKPTVVSVKPTDVIADTPEETVPEQYNIAMVGTVVIGNRTVCDNCHRSLNFHICGSPKVMYNGTPSVVVFKPRPNAETYRPNRWW